MEAKEVPPDLLPVHSLYLSRNDWAKRTYPYWCAFNVGRIPLDPTEDDLAKWRDAAADIMEELKAIGVSKAQEKICNMMNSYFTFEYKQKHFNNMFQVIDMLSDATFYAENIALFRDMVHMFQYGIFRTGYNGWAVDCANDWMRKRNIVYNNFSLGKQVRKGKGFVYKLIVNRASDSICNRLQSMTQRLYGEYVVVRDRKLKKYGEEYQLRDYTFNYRFAGYLCEKKKGYDHNDGHKRNNTEVIRMMALLEEAKKKGTTFNEFYNIMTVVVKDIKHKGKQKSDIVLSSNIMRF